MLGAITQTQPPLCCSTGADAWRWCLGWYEHPCPPPPHAGCEHLRNDHGVIVDFNTADPLIRWDSYENLSADGEGASGYRVPSYQREGPRGSSLFMFRSELSLLSAQRLEIPRLFGGPEPTPL